MNQDSSQLLRKLEQNDLDLQEQIELADLMSDPNNKDVLFEMKKEWEIQMNSDTESVKRLDSILDKIHHKIRLNENDTFRKYKLWEVFQRIAALFLLPLLISYIIYSHFNNNNIGEISYTEIQCPAGGRTKFQLPDGSIGYLNCGSTLRYQNSFVNERKVHLTGEAFFEIVHNEKLPFHVNTANLDIKVLGTSFNVVAYPDESTEEVVLQTGKVNISSVKEQALTELKPNERFIMNNSSLQFSKTEVESSQYTGWKEGRLIFRNENMQQVARRLSRWYNADVIVDDQMLEDYSFHATFIDEPLDEVLKLLSITTPIGFQEVKRTHQSNGIFDKRKIILKIDKEKLKQFK